MPEIELSLNERRKPLIRGSIVASATTTTYSVSQQRRCSYSPLTSQLKVECAIEHQVIHLNNNAIWNRRLRIAGTAPSIQENG